MWPLYPVWPVGRGLWVVGSGAWRVGGGSPAARVGARPAAAATLGEWLLLIFRFPAQARSPGTPAARR